MNKFTGLIRRCVEDYSMIKDGETIAVGVSGGKDSLALLYALSSLRTYYPEKFELHAVTLDLGFEDMDFTPVGDLCRELGIPYTVKKTNIREIVFEDRQEKNPCSLCAKMRRGALCGLLNDLGISKIALGHHYDDAIETFMMSLIYEGRLSCFQPVTELDRSGITQIRPMLYASEATITGLARRYNFPIVENPCPMDKNSKRYMIKELLKSLSKEYPDLKSKIFGAIQRLPLEGWKPHEYRKRPLP